MSVPFVRAALPQLFSAPTRGLGAGSFRVAAVYQPAHAVRLAHYEAFDPNLDEDDLTEARQWRNSFDGKSLPRGTTTFARSSGPGGQHVNKYACLS